MLHNARDERRRLYDHEQQHPQYNTDWNSGHPASAAAGPLHDTTQQQRQQQHPSMTTTSNSNMAHPSHQSQPAPLGGATMPAEMYASSSRAETARRRQWSQEQLSPKQTAHIYEELEFADANGNNGHGGVPPPPPPPPPPPTQPQQQYEVEQARLPHYRSSGHRVGAASTDPRKSYLRSNANGRSHAGSTTGTGTTAGTSSGQRSMQQPPPPPQQQQQQHALQHDYHPHINMEQSAYQQPQNSYQGQPQQTAYQATAVNSRPVPRVVSPPPPPPHYPSNSSDGSFNSHVGLDPPTSSGDISSSMRHSVMNPQSRSAASVNNSQHHFRNSSPNINTSNAAAPDSMLVYSQVRPSGQNDDDMSQMSGLSQQRLLRKRHAHRLANGQIATGSGSGSGNGNGNGKSKGQKKSYPRRNPNKQNVTIVGMPQSLGGSATGSGSARAAPPENAYERRLARERMRNLVRIGSMTRRRGSSSAARAMGYDGVESVDGAESTARSVQFAQQYQQQHALPENDSQQLSPPPPQHQQQLQQPSSHWWKDTTADEDQRSPPSRPQYSQQQSQDQQTQQHRVPRSDAPNDSHDGRGGYNFDSLAIPATAAFVDDSYEDLDERERSHKSVEQHHQGARGLYPATNTVSTTGPAAPSVAPTPPVSASSSGSSGVNVVPRQPVPYLAHSSSAKRFMEPIVEESPTSIRVGEMDRSQDSFHKSPQSPPPPFPAKEPPPSQASGEILFNQYSVARGRNTGGGGTPSPRLGVPPAPTSYYDRPDPHDPALKDFSYDGEQSFQQQQRRRHYDPNIVVGDYNGQHNDWDPAKYPFSDDTYAAAEEAAKAAIFGDSSDSPTSVAIAPSSSSVATHRVANQRDSHFDFEDNAGPFRSKSPSSVLTDEMSSNVPDTSTAHGLQQIHRPDPSPQVTPGPSPHSSVGTPMGSTDAIAPRNDPVTQTHSESERQEIIDKAHAIRQRRVKEAREQGMDLIRSSPQGQRYGNSINEVQEPLIPVQRVEGESRQDDFIDMPPSWYLTEVVDDGKADGSAEVAASTPDRQRIVEERGNVFPNGNANGEWEPEEKLPTKRDRRKGRASEDLKGRVIDLSAKPRNEAPRSPRVIYSDTQFGFVEAVAAVVIQTFIRRHIAYKTATARYEAALTVKDFIISSTQARWEAREVEQVREAHQREMILAKAQEKARKQKEEEARKEERVRHVERAYETAKERDRLRKEAMSEEDLSAVQIQAAFRGWWVRDCLSVDNYCATLIQQAVRGYLDRMAYEFDFYRIVIVQSAVRRFLARTALRKAKMKAKSTPEIQQVPKARSNATANPSSVPSWAQQHRTTTVPPPEAKTTYAKDATIVIESGRGKRSLIEAWKEREAQAAQVASKPMFVTGSRNVQSIHRETALGKEEIIQNRHVQNRPKDTNLNAVEKERNEIAATKIQSQWRCYASEMMYFRKLRSILIVQSLARRWVIQTLVLPYMIAARSGEHEYAEEYYDDEGQYAEEEDGYDNGDSPNEPEVAPESPAVEIGAEKKIKSDVYEPVEQASYSSKTYGARGTRNTGSNSLLNVWKEREQQALKKARGPGFA